MTEEEYNSLKIGDRVECIGVRKEFPHLKGFLNRISRVEGKSSDIIGTKIISLSWEDKETIDLTQFSEEFLFKKAFLKTGERSNLTYKESLQQGEPIIFGESSLLLKKVEETAYTTSSSRFKTNEDNWKGGLGLL